jgi:hypothetical protein
MEGEWSASCLGHFTSRKRVPEGHWVGKWADTQPGRTLCRKHKYVPIQEIETSFPGFQAHSLVTVFTELPIYRGIIKFGYANLNHAKSDYIRECQAQSIASPFKQPRFFTPFL